MSRHIGIVACSPPGAALCYQLISKGLEDPPEISIHAHPFETYMHHIHAGDWGGVGALMLDSAHRLAGIGADCLIAPCNTIHHAMYFVEPRSPRPWLHIAAEVAHEARRQGFRRVALLGTKLIMESHVYPDFFEPAGIAYEIPEPSEREHIDRFIFEEMVAGKFTEDARAYLESVIARMRGLGCDAAGLCCTELPLLFQGIETALPLLDSTRILATAALERSRKC